MKYYKVGSAYREWNLSKAVSISWWTRLRLCFRRTRVVFDWADNPNLVSTVLFYKELDGRIYIMKEELLPRTSPPKDSAIAMKLNCNAAPQGSLTLEGEK